MTSQTQGGTGRQSGGERGESVGQESQREAPGPARSLRNPTAFNDANDFMQDDDTGFQCVSNEADAFSLT